MNPDFNLDDNKISVVEDLDPEPVEVGGRGWWRSSGAREVVLGLLLLVCVVGWACFTWWRDEANKSNYGKAQQAAALRQWDEALAYYSSAAGYKDADAHATEISKLVNGRDSRYEAVRRYEQTGPAAHMLLTAREVQTIQPGYKDTDKLASEAEDRVYTDALSGTVVMRTAAQPPGLYYRGPTGWVYLRGSDQWSGVLTIPFSPISAHIVYDVPGPDWRPPGPLIRSPFGPYGYSIEEGSPDKVKRRLVMAALPHIGREATFYDLQLNPADYNFYISGNEGVWGIRYTPSISNAVLAKGALDGFSPTYEQIATLAAGGTANRVAPVTMPGVDGVIADFGHGGSGDGQNRVDSLLLAAHGPGMGDAAGTELYFSRADGSDPRLVFSTTGVLVSALLSYDDQHALVIASEPTNGSEGKSVVAATLLTLDDSAPPKTLQKISLDSAAVNERSVAGISPILTGQLSLSGVFLENGAFKGKLLLGWSNTTPAASVTLRLLDVIEPDKVIAETTMPYDPTGVLAVVEQPESQALLLYNQGVPPASVEVGALVSYLEVLQAESGTANVKASNYSVPLPVSSSDSGSTPYFMNPTLRGPNLIYSIESFTTQPETSNVYSVPLARLGGQERSITEPMQVLSRTWPTNRAVGDTGEASVGVAGPGAYAYADSEGTLHAHLFAEEVDVPLESGMGAIFALNANYFYKVLH